MTYSKPQTFNYYINKCLKSVKQKWYNFEWVGKFLDILDEWVNDEYDYLTLRNYINIAF